MPSRRAVTAAIYGLSGLTLTSEERDFFADAKPYGFILFARNCDTPEQLRKLTDTLKHLAGSEMVPILIDQEGGRVARLKPPHWPAYPAAGVFAAMKNQEQAARAVYLNARLIAADLGNAGITVDCAPVADVPVQGAHHVIGDRAFGATPQQVALLARAQAQGLMDGGIVPVLKHIPGHGRAGVDSHESLPTVDAPLGELRRTDFVPFQALRDLPMAMTAHVRYMAIDDKRMATLSPAAIKLIRDEIGFRGLLMTDDLSMKAMQGSFAERARAALSAGCDVVLHCNGEMQEMREVAEGADALAGESLARAQKAMSIEPADAFDPEQARAERDSLLEEAA